jgi:glyoxylase-like metal-dependent hydrolase (beta-lactamase superfamily II)
MEHADTLLETIGNRTVSHILVTHTHIDHSPLSAWLSAKTGAQILAYGKHGTGRTGGLDFESVEAGADKDFTPHKLIADGDLIQGDGWTIECIHTPGHTSNHVCFKLIEENNIFVGDHIMKWATTVISPPDGDMRSYLKSLEKLKEHGADLLLPTHGEPIDNPNAFIRGVLIHRRMREGQILDRLKDSPKTIDTMVKGMYKDVDPRLHPAAARSVFAHIIALYDEGRIECDGNLSLTAEYKLAKA